jgi:hypothetical protein
MDVDFLAPNSASLSDSLVLLLFSRPPRLSLELELRSFSNGLLFLTPASNSGSEKKFLLNPTVSPTRLLLDALDSLTPPRLLATPSTTYRLVRFTSSRSELSALPVVLALSLKSLE